MGIPKRGRQSLFAKRYGIAQPSSRRWLVGEGYPDIAVGVDRSGICHNIADNRCLGVNSDMSGNRSGFAKAVFCNDSNRIVAVRKTGKFF